MPSLSIAVDVSSSDDVISSTTAEHTTRDPVHVHHGDLELAQLSLQMKAEALAFSADSPRKLRQRRLQVDVVDQRVEYPTWMHPSIGGEVWHLQGPTSARQNDNEAGLLTKQQQQLKLREKLQALPSLPVGNLHQTEEETSTAADRGSSSHDTSSESSFSPPPSHGLSEWMATAISGNDILSSMLFTTGLTVSRAGKLAPLAHLLVVVVVYGLRRVLGEVMAVVPLNGGCYTALLHTTSKRMASMAAILSMLSYLATGVVCAVAAINYLNTMTLVPVVPAVVVMLFLFAALCIIGVAESAAIALAFFILHTLTVTLLAGFCVVFALQHPDILLGNMHAELPSVSVWHEVVRGNTMTALFYGYGTAVLGVTGFEASAQFIEQQAPGVFAKTLRNMWVLSSVFNMVFAWLSLAVLPLDGPHGILMHRDILLARMGRVTGGHWLELLVSIDACVVLAGAVLTSYVGMAGLLHRLALDRVLPQLLARRNALRGTPHVSILAYAGTAVSLVVVMNGDIDALSGVFTFAYLGVMLAFVVACMLLKIYRARIPRDPIGAKNTSTASWVTCLLCLLMLLVCVAANVLNDPTSLYYFVLYFAAIGVLVVIMLERVHMLRGLLFITQCLVIWWRTPSSRAPIPLPTNAFAPPLPGRRHRDHEVVGSLTLAKRIEQIKRRPVIFFCKTPRLPLIHDAVNYVLANEQTYCLRLVCLVPPRGSVPPTFEDMVCLFDHIYPTIKIDLVVIHDAIFDTRTITWAEDELAVPVSLMFMRQPTTSATHAVAAAGVRVITG